MKAKLALCLKNNNINTITIGGISNNVPPICKNIGGTLNDVPPIDELLVATSVTYLQSSIYWWQLPRRASNRQFIGGNFRDVPPIVVNNGGISDGKRMAILITAIFQNTK